jgi:DedD protein
MDEKLNKKNNDLSDIVLDDDTEKTEKLKKLLLGAASIILLILIILIIAKMLNKDGMEPKESISSVGDTIETQVENTTDSAVDAFDTIDEKVGNVVKESPVIDEASETDLKFEEMVRKLKEQDEAFSKSTSEKKETLEEPVVQVVNKAKSTNVIEEKMPTEVRRNVPAPAVIAQVPEKKVVQPQIIDFEPVKQKPVSTTTSQVFDNVGSNNYSTAQMSGYFIQVGATANTFPDKKYLRRIKNAGFDYIVHTVNIKGRNIKKILVGPYTTRGEAVSAIDAVRSSINPDAFIYRVK